MCIYISVFSFYILFRKEKKPKGGWKFDYEMTSDEIHSQVRNKLVYKRWTVALFVYLHLVPLSVLIIITLYYERGQENSTTTNYFKYGKFVYPVMNIVKNAIAFNSDINNTNMHENVHGCKCILKKRLPNEIIFLDKIKV